MKTSFTAEQLKDPELRDSEKILRTCVHCGFCTATCPTYVLLGDELDSPRGRIYLIKQMLEGGKPPTDAVVKHIDRCLSCLSCMTTCPSGVHYMHLVDHGRKHIEQTYRRPLPDRLTRRLLAAVLPRPWIFRLSLLGAQLARPLRRLLPSTGAAGRLRAMLELAPRSVPGPAAVDRPQVIAPAGVRRGRVALLSGCAQQVLAPQINEATVRLLTRHGIEVVVAAGAGCCGALTHHMGQDEGALRSARGNVDAWTRELDGEGLDAIVINASGCGTTVKDYGFMFREDAAYAAKARRVAEHALDISEYLSRIGLIPAARDIDLVVAYHAACSLQHGQQIRREPKHLLSSLGFIVSEPADAHLCCGSAGTYNLLQPELAGQLRDRKVATLERLKPDVIATGNIGCMTQIASGIGVPVVHTVELLDWATGGPPPAALAGRHQGRVTAVGQ
jgi:glycolate oxidase iron-sulfur subunit